MLSGSYKIPQIPEESICRTSEEYRFTDVGIYKIHANSLMSNIPFEKAKETKDIIDSEIFINNKKTKPKFKKTIKVQNYLSTFYVGRCPLEFYSGKKKTEIGRQFMLLCREGDPKENYRVFGTETAIRGFNKNAADMSSLPGGGDE